MDAKRWLRDNYKLLHRNGTIGNWLTEYPDIASKIEEAGLRGQSIEKVKNQAWQNCLHLVPETSSLSLSLFLYTCGDSEIYAHALTYTRTPALTNQPLDLP